jgi:hypothetical protein
MVTLWKMTTQVEGKSGLPALFYLCGREHLAPELCRFATISFDQHGGSRATKCERRSRM